MEQSQFMKNHQYKCWEIKNPDAYDWEKISFDGHGYVIMDDKSRFDSEDDLYREERLLWNSIKHEDFLYIKIGRWVITSDGIETMKENQEVIKFGLDEIWSIEKKAEGYVYSLPVYFSSKGWVSNVDLLDFNNAFLVCIELFENYKSENLPRISWSQTLRRQYKRFQNSLDINSYEGRKQYEFRQEYMKTASMEDISKRLLVNNNSELKQEIEIFGDSLSRNP